MSVLEIVSLILSAMLMENFVLVKFYGICPFLGVSKKIDTATGMGIAVTFVMTLSAAITWLAKTFFLVPFHLEYMETVMFILIIAALVQFVEMFLAKMIPALHQALGIYLPLITTNCAVLGVCLLNSQNETSFAASVIYAASAGLGFTMAIILFASIRERLELTADYPKSFEGFPIALISAGLLALAFMGFQGLNILG